ncbi:MAG TPA: peptidoglycan-binding domain-containing protein [Pyrinomonadaceae bacterium]|jgi:cytochrome c556|nr:peptidoglycan-binding domain-containing protein [Pyrinomonadaceae bacterium]
MFKKLFLIVSIVALAAITSLAQPGSSTSPPAAATPTAAKPAAFRATKDQIKQGQQILITQKLWTGEATGVYGTSRDGIKAYQKANGLDVNGKFDRATLEKMGISLTDKQKGIAAPTTTSTAKGDSTKQIAAGGQDTAGVKRPAPFQATKDQITALQKILKDGKMYDGEANGERSDALKESVKKYQTANSLNATGGINAATLQKAGIALTDKQKEQVAAQAAYDAAKKN